MAVKSLRQKSLQLRVFGSCYSVPVLAWHLMPRTILLSKVKAVAGKMATATQMRLVFGR